jgi:hypothetical protein
MSTAELRIDEVSPDEDECIAREFLMSNRGRNQVVHSGEQY